MNSGTYGFPATSEYIDYILGRNLPSGQLWDIPVTMPPNSSAFFEFEIPDGGGVAASPTFRFNNLPAASHTSQILNTFGTTTSSTSFSDGLFATTDGANSVTSGHGHIISGSRRIVYNSRFYRGAPGSTIVVGAVTGVADTTSLVTNPYNRGVTRLQLTISAGGVLAKGSRFRMYKVCPALGA